MTREGFSSRGCYTTGARIKFYSIQIAVKISRYLMFFLSQVTTNRQLQFSKGVTSRRVGAKEGLDGYCPDWNMQIPCRKAKNNYFGNFWHL